MKIIQPSSNIWTNSKKFFTWLNYAITIQLLCNNNSILIKFNSILRINQLKNWYRFKCTTYFWFEFWKNVGSIVQKFWVHGSFEKTIMNFEVHYRFFKTSVHSKFLDNRSNIFPKFESKICCTFESISILQLIYSQNRVKFN